MRVGAWPLVGREPETTEIDGMLAARGPGLLFAGPAGVGKSRLVAEAIERAAARGWAVVHLRATRAAASLPFGAFAPLLTSIAETTSRTMAGQLAVLTDRLGAERGGGPLLFAVDDAHLLDEGSAALLLHVVSSRRDSVVVSTRSGEPAPDAVTALWKEELLTRLDLAPLTAADGHRLVEEALGGVVDGPTARAIHQASGGNPLYIRELLLGSLASGALVDRRGVWRLERAVTASDRLAELIHAGLADLADEQRRVLGLVAVGEPLPLTWLEHAGHGDDVRLLDRHGLVTSERAGDEVTVRLAHPLYGEVLRASLTYFDQDVASAALVQAAEASGPLSVADVRRVALWRVGARLPADPAIVHQAAREARIAGDLHSAFRLGEAALRGGGGAPSAHLLGEMLDYIGRHTEAEQVLGLFSGTTEEEQALLALARADNLYWGLGRWEEAVTLTVDAEAALASPRWRDSVRAQRAKFLGFGRRWADALAVAEPLLAHPDPRVAADAALPMMQSLMWSGRPAAAVAVGRRGLEIRRSIIDELQVTSPEVHLVTLAMAMVEAGQIEDAATLVRTEYAAAVAGGQAGAVVWYALQLARLELVTGRIDDARRFAAEAAAGFGTVNVNGARWSLVNQARAAAHAGDGAAASAAVRDLAALPSARVRFLDVEEDLAIAWSHVSRGRVNTGRQRLWQAARAARSIPQPPLEATALFDIARLGDAASVAERLRELCAEMDGSLMPLRARYAAAASDGDGRGLDEVADGLGALGAHLWAAEAAAEAARAHSRAGSSRRAAASQRHATEHAARCPGARTPGLQTAGAPARLTVREREVARLAASGLASREIAASLGVSARTVETHLQNTYQKLGVDGRTALAEALQGSGAP